MRDFQHIEERVYLGVGQAQAKGTTSVFASNINYNEKGQRTDIYYGNGSKTRYDYDEETFRLNRLLTTRNTGSDILLDLNYIYDPVGNITEVDDPAQETIYYNNTEIKAKGKYTYDALYRLKTATGRELRSLQLPNQSDFANNIGFSSPEANSMQNYTQQFQYDELGNLIQMKSVNEWTRDYFYDFVEDNYLLGHTENTIEYSYDEHEGGALKKYLGDIFSERASLSRWPIKMPHLSSMLWDYKDELKEVTLNASNDTAYYVYDASGERVRKVIEKTGGIVEERLYMGGFEVYRKSVAGTLDFERETLHISDNQKKIVSIETKTKENATSIHQTYEIKFWGVDEEMTGNYGAPHFEAQIKILDRQKLVLFNQKLVSIHEVITGGQRVTHDGISYSHTPTLDETIEIQAQINRGDYMDIEIYENLSSEGDALPGFSIIIALVGLVIYFRGRKKA